ncbi:MAG: porin family protein [Gemmatimonadaceae bacterium]
MAAVCAVFVVSSTSQAQVPGLDIGVTAGVNLATVSGGGDDTKNLTGFMVGVSFIHRMTHMFAFQPEIAYSMKGAKFDDGVDEGEVKINYIDVPLLLKITLGPEMTMGQARPALYLGPYAAFNMSCDIKTEGVSVECDAFDAEPKTVDFGAIAGVGMDFGNFNIFARYQFGLTSISDDVDDDAKNRVIQIGGRFSFRGR